MTENRPIGEQENRALRVEVDRLREELSETKHDAEKFENAALTAAATCDRRRRRIEELQSEIAEIRRITTVTEAESLPAYIENLERYRDRLEAENSMLCGRVKEQQQKLDQGNWPSDWEYVYKSFEDEIRGLRERIEELEKSVPMTGPHPWYGPCDGFGPGGSCQECKEVREHCLEQNYHHITTAQIDAAWEFTDIEYDFSNLVLHALRKLGIFACVGYKGSGVVDVMEPGCHAKHNEDCPGCYGHGWTIK